MTNPPIRKENKEFRTREYMTIQEVTSLIGSIPISSRTYNRDTLLILSIFRHGFRVSEAANLKFHQIDFDNKVIHVSRLKGSTSSTHPILEDEFIKINDIRKESGHQQYVFLSLRKTKMSTVAIYKVIKTAGKLANLPFPIHPHMLRHSTGYYLANKGIDTRAIQAYMGHSNIQNTVGYTALSSKRFDGFWD